MGNLISSFLHKYESIVSPPKPINSIPEVIIPRNRIFTNINHSKKGLIIGINYISNNIKNDDLNGCVNDLVNLKAFLKQRCFFSKGQIKTLENEQASKENIINEINNLVFGLKNFISSK